jgi:hypothetical protein
MSFLRLFSSLIEENNDTTPQPIIVKQLEMAIVIIVVFELIIEVELHIFNY